ncbi:MAG TPA: type II secretion system F family protein [Pontiellaceae bacterium]|nr:type II secretion system F family protein [Pontiellaceae bacterium]HPR82278.1 type II secretion system F family protein [Pontiellaceae bacterium]
MNKFNYTAKNTAGDLIRDMIEAESRQSALTTLRQKGLTVVSLTDVEPVLPVSAETAKSKDVGGQLFRRRSKEQSGDLQLAPKKNPGSKKIHLTDMAVFCRQLAISVNSGLPLREALEGIHEDMDQPALKAVLANIIKKLYDGIPFSSAVAAHPKVFSPVFIGMVQAAEQSGTLGETLNRLAGYIESSDKLRRKIKSLMAYPIFVAAFFIIICLVMVVAIIPRFQDIFNDLHAKLPALTRGVFGLNNFILQNVPLILAFAVLLTVVFIFCRRIPSVRLWLDRTKLKMPITGVCLKRYILARICRCTAIMLKSGVPISTTLRIVSAIGDNLIIEQAIVQGQAQIISGSNIADGFKKTGIFPSLLIRMLRVGESAGRLPDVLDRVADAYEDQVEASIVTATALLEPVIISVFGLMVLVLVLSIYLPVFTVSTHIR